MVHRWPYELEPRKRGTPRVLVELTYCLRGVVAMYFVFNPNAEEFVPKAEEQHRHIGERSGCSVHGKRRG